MPAIPADVRTFHYAAQGGKYKGSFRPNGRLAVVSEEGFTPNPQSWRSEEPLWSARLFVGFSVGETPTYDVDDLIEIVMDVRQKQSGRADSTFLLQKGVFTHTEPGPHQGKVVVENGAQVIILNLDDVPVKEFEKQMEDLAETIAAEMQQESVIVELQRGGQSKMTMGVAALEHTKRKRRKN